MSVLDFNPLPFLSNPHVQTLLGNFLGGADRILDTRPLSIRLDDGDQLVMHDGLPDSWQPGRPVALLIHGLGGCHRSSYVQRFSLRLAQYGIRVFSLDLRGAGTGLRLARRLYNAASAPDIRATAEAIARLAPGSPLWVVGFSLGGNIVLNFAAEAAARPLPTLEAVAAIAPPIDLARCSEMMARLPWYNAFYVRHLTGQVRRHQRYFPDLPRVVFPRGMSLRGFDEIYTAPRGGYAGVPEYYRAASAFPRVGAIRVPTFILTARDDPFIAVEPFEELTTSVTPNLEVQIAPGGGHLGFLGDDGRGGIRWAETRVLEWLLEQDVRMRPGRPLRG